MNQFLIGWHRFWDTIDHPLLVLTGFMFAIAVFSLLSDFTWWLLKQLWGLYLGLQSSL